MTEEEYFDGIDPDLNLPQVNSSCKYYTIDQYNANYNNFVDEPNFRLLNFNIRSFHAHKAEFNVFLGSLIKLPQVIILTETWNSENNVDLCELNGYDGVHSFRNISRVGGGVSIFSQSNFTSYKVESLSKIYNSIETCCMKINLDSERYIAILGIYSPPTGGRIVNEFLDELGEILMSPVLTNAYLVAVAGDMNINILQRDTNDVLLYETLMNSYNFIPVINKPTRFSQNAVSSSNLDHIWINSLSNYTSGIINIDISDHLPTFYHSYLPYTNNDLNKKIRIEFRPFSEEKLELLASKFFNTNWDDIMQSYNCTDTLMEYFLEKLDYCYCDCFPVKIKYLSFKRILNPWIGSELLREIRLKSDYYKQFRLGLISRQTNNRFKNRVNKSIDLAKKLYYQNCFNLYKNDAIKSWKTIHKLMGTKKSDTSVKELIINGLSYTDDLEIADKFNEYFTQIGSNLDADLPPSNTSPLSWMPSSHNRSFYLSPVSEQECRKFIAGLKNSRTSKNVLPVHLFKILSPILAPPLTHIMNECFRKAIFPKCLKVGRVIQIYKSGIKTDPSNYRPITTLPYISKLLEKCLTSRLAAFFDKFSLLTEFQYGFRAGISTESAISHFCNLVYDNFNSKEYLTGVLIDFRKAFDTISHDILLNKLQVYGVRGPPLQLLKSYLSNRKQFVSINQVDSDFRPINIGLPQGSCLAPFLFLVYINDLPNASQLLKFTLFADDTTLSITNDSYSQLVSDLNVELNRVTEWTTSNRLTINASKTNAIVFTNKNLPNIDHPIMLGSHQLSVLDDCRFLGVQIDSKLDFKLHIDQITRKIARNTGIFFKIRNNLPLKARLDFYYGFVYPYLIYSVTVWGGTYGCHLSKLIVQQKRIIRAISDAGVRDHTRPLFFELKLLNLEDIYRYFVGIFMFKNIDHFRTNHDRATRNLDLAIPRFCRLTKCQQSIMFTGPNIWNTLPASVKRSSSLPTFKKNLKDHFISSYRE